MPVADRNEGARMPQISRSRECRIRGVLKRRGRALHRALEAMYGRSMDSVAGAGNNAVQAANQVLAPDDVYGPDAIEYIVNLISTDADWAALDLAETFKGCDVIEGIVRALALADPTDCGTYIDWLVAQWMKSAWRVEDTPRIRDDLVLFDRNRHRLAADGARDIQTYASPQALLQAVRGFRRGAIATSVLDRPEMTRPPQAHILLDNAQFRVVMPLTAEAAAFWGDGTEWCVTWGVPGSRHPSRASRYRAYAQLGPLLMVCRHSDKTMWAIHLFPDSISLWDASDERMGSPLARLTGMIDPAWRGLLEGQVLDVMAGTEPCIGILLEIGEALKDDPVAMARAVGLISNPREITQWPEVSHLERRLALERDPSLIEVLPHPTAEERMRAIQLHPRLVLQLRDVTETDRLLAIETDPSVIASLRDLTVAERGAAFGDPGEGMAA